MLKKAITHVHTHHSFDCITNPAKIVEKAIKMNIDYLLISDHDTLAGSIEAAAYAKEKGYPIHIPIAAEYYTEIGDVIVGNVPPDFQSDLNNHVVLCREAKEQGGFTILPHPYKAHDLDKIDFSLIDCIEVFNPRCNWKDNLSAIALAKKLNKPTVYGSDAHTLIDLENAVFSYLGNTPFNEQTAPLRLLPTPWYRKEYSHIVRSIKRNQPKEFLRGVKRGLIQAYNRCLRTSYDL